MNETELGRFIHWGPAVTIDSAARLMTELPFARPEDLVEFAVEDCPEEETLDLRCTSY